MTEKFKLPRQHSRFNLYQRLFIQLVTTHAEEWDKPSKEVAKLLQMKEDWDTALVAIPKSTVHNYDAVKKRGEVMTEYSSLIEFVMEYYILRNAKVAIADKILLGISGF